MICIFLHQPAKNWPVQVIPLIALIGKVCLVRLSEFVASEFFDISFDHCGGQVKGMQWQEFGIQECSFNSFFWIIPSAFSDIAYIPTFKNPLYHKHRFGIHIKRFHTHIPENAFVELRMRFG